MGRNNKQNRRQKSRKRLAKHRALSKTRRAQSGDGFVEELSREEYIAAGAALMRGAPLPLAPDVSAEAVRAAKGRLSAWLSAPENADEVQACRAVFDDALQQTQGARRRLLERVIDEWTTCDVGWPQTPASMLATAAEVAGDVEIASALWAMHDSHLLVWQAGGESDRSALGADEYVLVRAHSTDHVIAQVPYLEGPLAPQALLAGRLWPSGDGRWALASGALPYVEALMVFVMPPDVPGVDPEVVERNVWALVRGWVRELKYADASHTLPRAA